MARITHNDIAERTSGAHSLGALNRVNGNNLDDRLAGVKPLQAFSGQVNGFGDLLASFAGGSSPQANAQAKGPESKSDIGSLVTGRRTSGPGMDMA